MGIKKISVIGLGYIGLPTAAMFAAKKIQVRGVDVSPQVVETVNAGKIHFVEPKLERLVQDGVKSGYLEASLEVGSADAFLIAVPTPFINNHQPDLTFIKSAVMSIAPVLKRGDLVIVESTCPVGTTQIVNEWLAEERHDLSFPADAGDQADVNLAYCPERVLPGNVVRELQENDRIIGGMTPACAKRGAELYKLFVTGECVITDAKTAEMAKLVENSFRDVNIAFANELSILCENFGIDVWDLIKVANKHPRVNILNPGAGVGGHCIAVDPWFIVHQAGDDAKIIRAARNVNDYKADWVVARITSECGVQADRLGRPPKVACMGLSFKPDIDDLRESPALDIYKKLRDAGIDVLAVEPNLESHIDIPLLSYEEAIEEADIVVFLVGHKEFVDRPVRKAFLDFCGVTRLNCGLSHEG
jgi:UDP-N-acetyl-D-mannosaminuronic acid dehydrogenase